MELRGAIGARDGALGSAFGTGGGGGTDGALPSDAGGGGGGRRLDGAVGGAGGGIERNVDDIGAGGGATDRVGGGGATDRDGGGGALVRPNGAESAARLGGASDLGELAERMLGGGGGAFDSRKERGTTPESEGCGSFFSRESKISRPEPFLSLITVEGDYSRALSASIHGTPAQGAS